MISKALFSLRNAKYALMCLALLLASTAMEGGAYAQNNNIRRFEGRTLTIAGYSSTFNDQWQKSFGEYFENRTGVKVKWIPSSIPANITRIRSAGGKPDIDAMLMDSANLARGVQADVVGKLDPASVPNLSKVPASLRIDSGIPTMLYRYGGACYRKDKFAELKLGEPTTTDAWFAKKLSGRVMFPSATSNQWLITLPAIVKSLGGEYDKPAKVLDELSKIKAYGFYNASGDVDVAMTSGDVWLTVGNIQGRCLALKRQGVPVEYTGWHFKADGKQYVDVINPDNLVLVKGGDNKELVELFMNEFLSDDAISATVPLYKFIAGTPPTTAAVKKLLEMDPETKIWIIQNPDELFLPNYGDFLTHIREWTTDWSKILR
jgi:spermidine/putrescine-binding protein